MKTVTHNHYTAVDVTKELPTKSGWYHTEFTDDEGTKIIGRAHWNNDVQFFQSQAYHDGSKVLVETWLKPCTEAVAVEQMYKVWEAAVADIIAGSEPLTEKEKRQCREDFNHWYNEIFKAETK